MVISPPPSCPPARRRAAGFTLVELLAVLAIIGVLVALTLGVVRAVNMHAKISQTSGELAGLVSALNDYKRQFGDYPQVEDTPGNAKGGLADALTGKVGPTGASLGSNTKTWAKGVLDETRYHFSNPDQILVTAGVSEILDPFGNQYRYIYKAQINKSTWKNPGYLLYSAGPDGLSNDNLSTGGQAGGYLNNNDPINIDNIYASPIH